MCIAHSYILESEILELNKFGLNLKYTEKYSIIYVLEKVLKSGNLKAIIKCIEIIYPSCSYWSYDIKDDIKNFAPNDIQIDIRKALLKLDIDNGVFSNIELEDLDILKENFDTVINNEVLTEILNNNDKILIEWFYEYFKYDNYKLCNLMDIVINGGDEEAISYLWKLIKKHFVIE